MRYSYKILKSYIEGDLKFEEMNEYLNILGLNPKIVNKTEEDIIFEIEIPTNRPDLLSFTGLLREILPFGNFSLKSPDSIHEIETISDYIPVDIEDIKDCPYYSCRIIKGIKNIISSGEFKNNIEKIGFRSSFLVVDISNFVMCELGQPLHIFDLDKIEGRIIVRRGKKGEKLITIDGKERDLEDILIIADEKKPIAIAGIMGGMNTEVDYNTKNILIESAYFNPAVVRKGSKKLGLVTEASLRFEKGLSVYVAKKGMERTTNLIKELCGGEIGKLSFSGEKEEDVKKQIYLRKNNVEKILGIKSEDSFIKNIFEKLGIGLEKKDNEFILTVPDYRKDLKEEIDIIEEIAKYKKYSEIPSEIPVVNIKPSPSSLEYESIKKMKDILINLGFYEVITLSFISDKIVEKFAPDAIKIENPLSQTFSFLRNSLIFNILEVLKYNMSHQNKSLEMFEFGTIYKKDKNRYVEKESLLISSFNCGTFFDFKGKIERFFYECGLENLDYVRIDRNFSEKGTNYELYYSEEKISDLFLVSKELKTFYDIEGEVYICEIYIEKLLEHVNFERKFKQLPKFPYSQRDFSFLFPKDINWKELETEIIKLNLPIEEIEVFDIYKGGKIPIDKISISFSIIFRSSEKTLESEEINNFSKIIIEMIEKKFKGKLRGENV